MTDRELDLNVSVQTGTPGKPVKKTVSVWGGGGARVCHRRLRSILSLDLGVFCCLVSRVIYLFGSYLCILPNMRCF